MLALSVYLAVEFVMQMILEYVRTVMMDIISKMMNVGYVQKVVKLVSQH